MPGPVPSPSPVPLPPPLPPPSPGDLLIGSLEIGMSSIGTSSGMSFRSIGVSSLTSSLSSGSAAFSTMSFVFSATRLTGTLLTCLTSEAIETGHWYMTQRATRWTTSEHAPPRSAVSDLFHELLEGGQSSFSSVTNSSSSDCWASRSLSAIARTLACWGPLPTSATRGRRPGATLRGCGAGFSAGRFGFGHGRGHAPFKDPQGGPNRFAVSHTWWLQWLPRNLSISWWGSPGRK